jgi:hypothetical protein
VARVHPLRLPRNLQDYRDRYALHKSDPALQAAHACAPWAVTWDDHEVQNDYAAGQGRGERGPFPLQAMFQAALGGPATWGDDQGKPGPIRFRIRDLSTRGRVSELVPAEVTWYTRARYRPLAAVLRGRP